MEEDTVAADGEKKTGEDAVMADATKEGQDAAGDAGAADAGAAPKEEPKLFELGNPARVVPQQREFVRLVSDNRWQPVRFQSTGIVVLKNTKPDEPVSYAFDDEQEKVTKDENPADNPPAEEPAPEPFDYVPS